jgi:SAM-dependent methyltransferase
MTMTKKDPTTFFTLKAASYDEFRWDYAPEAVAAVLKLSAVAKQSTMADIGSGTGILTRHFLDKVGTVYAVEPNRAMRQIAEEHFADRQAFRSISNRAESTTLITSTLDLVVVGQALHWFDLNQAPFEISRILRPDGWLAVFWNTLSEGDLLESLMTLFNRFEGGERRRTTSDILPPYFQGLDFQKLAFRAEHSSGWDQFLGGTLTASWAPDVEGSDYEAFSDDVRAIFDKYCSGGEITIEVISHVAIGQPNTKRSP